MTDAITIACVWVGEKYGAEYPAILQDMVRRHVSPTRSLRFVCITDRPDELPAGMEAIEPEPGLPGWWQKLALFKPGKIPGERIAYFDLDVVILNSLDALLDRPGIIKEWVRPGYNSSVMVWVAGDHAEAWASLTPDDMERLPSDQQKLDELGGWEPFPRHWCVSHKGEATFWPPYDAKVVVFHGRPNPHEFTAGWVPMAWKIGGLTGLPTSRGINVPEPTMLEHVRSACQRDLLGFTGAPENDRECCIVGGGPSLTGSLPEIMLRVDKGAALVSLNGSLRWLLNRGMTPSSHVVLDARPENVEFVRDLPPETTMLVASQCHPAVFDALADHPREKTILWHCGTSHEGLAEIIKAHAGEDGALIIGGGSTVGLRTMFLAYASGFRKLHLYGFDSCFHEGERHHAYHQALNDGDTRTEVVMAGNRYVCAPWMARQAQEFNWIHEVLTRDGCEVWAHGKGLIPDICRLRNLHSERAKPDDIELLEGVWYPLGEYVGPLRNPAEVAKVADLLPLCRKHEVAVQAGANVGLVPIELAKHFGRVVAFEPQPANIAAARRNMNGSRFELIHAALGDAPGTARMVTMKGNSGATQTLPGGAIQVATIDSLALPACDLIMLDVEGSEALALQGARQTIEAHRPVVVIEEKGLGERYGWPSGATAAWLAVTFDYREAGRLGKDVVMIPNERA